MGRERRVSRVRCGQERAIAELQSENVERITDFLANKFTNVELLTG
jgi:hypothetical protein